MKRVFERSLALFIGLFVVVVALEILLRFTASLYAVVWGPSRGVPDDLQGKRIILVMGDSMTYGVGASRGNSYPDQLGRLLDPSLDFAVVNGGLAGANTTMVRALLEDFLVRLQPEVVTILAGGTNKVNFYGLNAFLRRDSLGAHAWDLFHHVGVVRMARFFGNQLSGARSETHDVVFDGLGAGVAACARWHAGQGQPVSETFRRGAALLRISRFEDALVVFQGGLADDTSLLWGIGSAWKGLRDDAQARAAFERCLSVDPRDPNCMYGIGEILIEGTPQNWAGNPALQEAQGWFQRGVDADPAFAANWWGLGMVRMKANDPRGSVDAFLRCVQADPNDARCYPNLASQASFTGRRDELARVLAQVRDQSPVAADTLQALQVRRDDPSLAEWVRFDLGAMVDLARSSGARVVLQTYPYADSANAILASVALDRGLPLVDQEGAFGARLRAGTKTADLFSADGHHCSDAGYGLMAASLAEAVTAGR